MPSMNSTISQRRELKDLAHKTRSWLEDCPVPIPDKYLLERISLAKESSAEERSQIFNESIANNSKGYDRNFLESNADRHMLMKGLPQALTGQFDKVFDGFDEWKNEASELLLFLGLTEERSTVIQHPATLKFTSFNKLDESIDNPVKALVTRHHQEWRKYLIACRSALLTARKKTKPNFRQQVNDHWIVVSGTIFSAFILGSLAIYNASAPHISTMCDLGDMNVQIYHSKEYSGLAAVVLRRLEKCGGSVAVMDNTYSTRSPHVRFYKASDKEGADKVLKILNGIAAENMSLNVIFSVKNKSSENRPYEKGRIHIYF